MNLKSELKRHLMQFPDRLQEEESVLLNDKQKDSSNIKEEKSSVNLTELKSFPDLTTIEFDDSTGFVCDVNTGICGPVTEKKEGEK